MSTWTPPTFDRHAFAGRRLRAVSSETHLSFQDFGRMHLQRRERTQERRLPTPQWAIRDEWLRELLVTYLEERFYIRATQGKTLLERLAAARATAENYAPQKRQLLANWLDDYHVLSTKGRADLSDEDAIAAFISLKHIGGQLPINADIAREYLAQKKLYDLEIQIQNIDTDLVLTEKGHAEMIAAIVYLFYRLGWDSVTVAEQLHLKPPHVRQVLARLHATWEATLSQRFSSNEKESGKYASASPSSAECPTGDTSLSSQPFDAMFSEAV